MARRCTSVPGHATVLFQRLGDLAADRQHRIERVIGSWNTMPISPPRISRISAAELHDIATDEADLTACDASGGSAMRRSSGNAIHCPIRFRRRFPQAPPCRRCRRRHARFPHRYGIRIADPDFQGDNTHSRRIPVICRYFVSWPRWPWYRQPVDQRGSLVASAAFLYQSPRPGADAGNATAWRGSDRARIRRACRSLIVASSPVALHLTLTAR